MFFEMLFDLDINLLHDVFHCIDFTLCSGTLRVTAITCVFFHECADGLILPPKCRIALMTLH